MNHHDDKLKDKIIKNHMISHKADVAVFIALMILIVIIGSAIIPSSVQIPVQPGSIGQTTNQEQDTTEASGSGCKIVDYLPDPKCTPGATDPRVTQDNIRSTICVSGYTATVRPPVSVTDKIKTERMQAYGFANDKSYYELDHLISLELGGSPDSVLNLFPEPYAEPYGARDKDKVENYLHKEVCDGSISLQEAQEEIRTNWVGVYDKCCAF
jgi:hypothetical protein